MQDAETERQALFEEAAAWWVTLDGGADDGDQAAFRAWMERSPAHRAAFAEVCALWGELEGRAR
ncbi:FecR/PupR family sigma factor regulator, partial [Methylogaea oryzae]|uniref:FecR/PupR family sigma factor regulator n=1 Tax=Methylogaea oryzae TaxID=1295382 RepID=UPI0012E1AFA6